MPDIAVSPDVRSCPNTFTRTKWLRELISSGDVQKVIVNDFRDIDSWTSGRIVRIENEGDKHIIYVKKEK